MRSFVGFLLVYCSLAASAAPSTAYDQLIAQFNAGQPLKFADIDGWYSGRCFERAAKDVALPGLLAIAEFSAGPKFPVQTYVRNMMGMDSGRNPMFFDLLTTPAEKQRLANHVFKTIAVEMRPSREATNGIETDMLFSDTNRVATAHEFRQSGTTVVMVHRARAAVDFNFGGRNSSNKESFSKGQIIEACYYFQRIMTRQEAESLR